MIDQLLEAINVSITISDLQSLSDKLFDADKALHDLMRPDVALSNAQRAELNAIHAYLPQLRMRAERLVNEALRTTEGE